MIDPFDLLRDELVRAASRTHQGAARRRWWSRRPSHRLAVALAVCVIGGSAAAAAVSLVGSPSKPLAGTVPGRPHRSAVAFPEAGRRYRVLFAPILNAGQAGWSGVVVLDNASGQAAGLGFVGGSYPSASVPIVGANAYGFRAGPAPRGQVVQWLLTAPDVAAVRVGKKTIRTRTTPDIPAGDRVAVFFEPASAPPILIPPARTKLPYYVDVPRAGRVSGKARIRVTRSASGHRTFIEDQGSGVRERAITPIPLSASGAVIVATPAVPAQLLPQIVSWNARPPAPGNPIHTPTHPLSGACEIAQHGLPTLKPQWGSVILAVQPVANASGELLLSCNDTEYSYDHWPLTVTILVNARRPGAEPGPIPGTTPVPGQPGTVAGDGEAARRIRGAWLLVNGGRNLHDQLAILRALAIAKLTLRASAPSRSETLTTNARACLLDSGFMVAAGQAPFGPYVLDVPARGTRRPVTTSAEIYVFDSIRAANAADPTIRRLSTAATHTRISRHGPATVVWHGTPSHSDVTAVNRCLPS
jgi:hypothetical protein